MDRTLRWSCVYRRFSCRDSEYDVQQGAALHSTVVAGGAVASLHRSISRFRFAFLRSSVSFSHSSFILEFHACPRGRIRRRGPGWGPLARGRRGAREYS